MTSSGGTGSDIDIEVAIEQLGSDTQELHISFSRMGGWLGSLVGDRFISGDRMDESQGLPALLVRVMRLVRDLVDGSDDQVEVAVEITLERMPARASLQHESPLTPSVRPQLTRSLALLRSAVSQYLVSSATLEGEFKSVSSVWAVDDLQEEELELRPCIAGMVGLLALIPLAAVLMVVGLLRFCRQPCRRHAATCTSSCTTPPPACEPLLSAADYDYGSKQHLIDTQQALWQRV
jgi:hypothetical protein